MSFYAISTVLVHERLRTITSAKQVWLADDTTGAGTVNDLLQWGNLVISEGRKYGYHVNESKSWLIAKDDRLLELAKDKFCGSSVKYTTDGKRHLGAMIGSAGYKKEYATEKVDQWCNEMRKLAEIAISEPQAAFAAYTRGEMQKFNYFLRTIPNMEDFLAPLDKVIDDEFLPALLRETVSDTDRELFKLPIRDGGLGIPILTQKAVIDCKLSIDISAPLVEVIVSQGTEIPSKETIKQVRHVRTEIINDFHRQEREKVISELDNDMKRALSQNCEKSASSWLTILPLKEQGFNLTKDEFIDVLAVIYNRKIKNLPSKCAYGQALDTNYAMNCKKEGFVTIHHNNVKDFEANLLKMCAMTLKLNRNYNRVKMMKPD